MRGLNLTLLIARIPPKIMLLLMLTTAVAAGVMVQAEFQKRDGIANDLKNQANKKEMSEIVVAQCDIPEGATISAESLKLSTIESNKVPFGAIQSTGAALGMQARVPIHAGETILPQQLGTIQAAKGFEAKIKPGYRAITFGVDASTGVAGFLMPDCYVDIMAQTGTGADAKATPILSDVQVVAVGQTYQKKNGDTEAQPNSSVTVSVLPREAGKLINAMTAGKLYCLMRNHVDHAPVAVQDVSSAFPRPKAQDMPSEISSIPAIPLSVAPDLPEKLPVVPPAQSLHNVQMWNASKKDELNFPQQ